MQSSRRSTPGSRFGACALPGLRIERCTENAAALATFFATRPEVAAVHYPGRARRTRTRRSRAGCCRVAAGRCSASICAVAAAAADAFIRGLDGVRLAPSLGDVATTVSYPDEHLASMRSVRSSGRLSASAMASCASAPASSRSMTFGRNSTLRSSRRRPDEARDRPRSCRPGTLEGIWHTFVSPTAATSR